MKHRRNVDLSERCPCPLSIENLNGVWVMIEKKSTKTNDLKDLTAEKGME